MKSEITLLPKSGCLSSFAGVYKNKREQHSCKGDQHPISGQAVNIGPKANKTADLL